MKKDFLIIFLLILTISSCERDDICIDDVTPDFKISFFDIEEPTESKSISRLSIKLLDTEVDTLFLSGDSIQLPIRNDIDTTRYSIANQISDTETLTDTITLIYTREDVFVGRACGFKTIFNEVQYEHTNNWIANFEIVTENIKDENAAHVKISH